MELPELAADRYAEMNSRDTLFIHQGAFTKSILRACSFIPTFFIVMGLQQRSRLTKRLPYAMTHRYFLVLPLVTAFATQEAIARRFQKSINRQLMRDYGYHYDETAKKWLRQGPPTKTVFAF